jgi:superoxide reductase
MDYIMKTKFYVCEKCGNLVDMVNDSGVNPVCCGQKMTELKAGVVEASREKHIPVVTVEGNVVKATVGAVEHPMSEEHSIEWVYLETDRGVQRKRLAPGEAPTAEFHLGDEKPVAVYAYCNLHGLWRADI